MNRWHLIFRAEGDGARVECRVRRLLKAALRCIGYDHDDTPRHSTQDQRSRGGMTRKGVQGRRTQQRAGEWPYR